MGYVCRIEKQNYVGPRGKRGRLALLLKGFDDGSPVGNITVNLPDANLDDPNEVCVHNWSAGEGMLKALVDAGIATDTGRRVPTGFVEAPIVTLNHTVLREYL